MNYWQEKYEYMTRFRRWSADDQLRLNEIKRELSRTFERVAHRNGYTQRMLAARLGTSHGRISEALGSNLDRVSVSQLVRYIIQLEPHFRVQIAI